MPFDVPYKTKQFFFLLIKLSIVVAAFYFMYSKLTQNDNLQLEAFIAFLKEKDTFSPQNILFLIVLSSFNWCFEILKWQRLVLSIKPISFKNALEQSLGGLTASLITPNRIGEYGAKAVYYAKPLRSKIVLLNLLGNMAQMTVTTILGLIGFIAFLNQYPLNIAYHEVVKIGLIIVLLTVIVGFGMRLTRFKIKGHSLERVIGFIKNTASKTLVSVLLLSLIRYVVFSFQFYYLLLMFGVNLDYSETMITLTSMYLLASILPSLLVFDVLIKGSVAVFLFGFSGINEFTVVAVVTLMWLFNFGLPSFFGSYFVLSFKLPQPEA